MNTIFVNSKNSKRSDPHRLLLNITDKIDLQITDKYIALSNLSIYYTWINIKKSCKNNKFKISTPTGWRIWITWWIKFYIRYLRLFWIYTKKAWGEDSQSFNKKINQ